MRFLLLLAISSKKETIIYCLDCDKAILIESLRADFSSMLDMLFIDHQITNTNINEDTNAKSNMNDTKHSKSKKKNNSINNNEVPFCLIFKKKITYFTIRRSNDSISNNKKTDNNSTQKYCLKQTTLLRISSGSILNYQYCPHHMILCCEKTDYSFAFFNLSNEKYYSKNYIVKIDINKVVASTNNSIAATQNDKSSHSSNTDYSKHYNWINYSKSQFFLQAIYNKLFFIYLSLINGRILVYRVKNLNTLETHTEIPIQSTYATLQFVDNLILFHDFNKEKTSVYDLRMKNRHFLFYPPLPITNHNLLLRNNQLAHVSLSSSIIVDRENDNNSNEDDDNYNDDYAIRLNINFLNEGKYIPMTKYSHNTMIYDKELMIKGDILKEISSDNSSPLMYYIYFDPELFYNNYYHTHFHDKDQINCMGRRSKTKEVMLQALIDMIERNNPIKLIRAVFIQIIHRLYKRYKDKVISLANESLVNSNNTTIQSEPIELIVPHYQSNRDTKYDILKQTDVYSAFIKHFEHSSVVQPYYIITLLIHLSKGLVLMNLPLHNDLMSTMLCFIKKTVPLRSLRMLFQIRAIPDYTPLSLFLIEESDKEDDKELFQIGIDMLIRLKQYEEILLIMIKKQLIKEVFLFIKIRSLKITNRVKETLKDCLKINNNNRSIIYQFHSNIQ